MEAQGGVEPPPFRGLGFAIPHVTVPSLRRAGVEDRSCTYDATPFTMPALLHGFHRSELRPTLSWRTGWDLNPGMTRIKSPPLEPTQLPVHFYDFSLPASMKP